MLEKLKTPFFEKILSERFIFNLGDRGYKY